VSDFSGQQHGFKVSLWSKVSPSKIKKINLRGRPAIIGLYHINGSSFSVACVHLTSNAVGDESSKRKDQLCEIYEMSRGHAEHCVVM